jgi:hypothetical protein
MRNPSELRIADCGLRIQEAESSEVPDCGLRIEEERVRGAEDSGLTRRDMLKLTAAAAAALPLIGGLSAEGAAQWRAPKFFSREEFLMVEELSEIIIPTDAHSPGARAAGVAAFIDSSLAESWTDEPKMQWREGLKTVDSICREMHGTEFMKASAEQRVAVVARMAQSQLDPQKPEEHFFRELKGRTVHAYYSSKIGIHDEMEYKGNVPIKEFVGTDVSGSGSSS